MQNYLNEQDAIIFQIVKFTGISEKLGISAQQMLAEEQNPHAPVL
jgi:hypothetical protein